jgi:hypothetical protein
MATLLLRDVEMPDHGSDVDTASGDCQSTAGVAEDRPIA